MRSAPLALLSCLGLGSWAFDLRGSVLSVLVSTKFALRLPAGLDLVPWLLLLVAWCSIAQSRRTWRTVVLGSCAIVRSGDRPLRRTIGVWCCLGGTADDSTGRSWRILLGVDWVGRQSSWRCEYRGYGSPSLHCTVVVRLVVTSMPPIGLEDWPLLLVEAWLVGRRSRCGVDSVVPVCVND